MDQKMTEWDFMDDAEIDSLSSKSTTLPHPGLYRMKNLLLKFLTCIHLLSIPNE